MAAVGWCSSATTTAACTATWMTSSTRWRGDLTQSSATVSRIRRPAGSCWTEPETSRASRRFSRRIRSPRRRGSPLTRTPRRSISATTRRFGPACAAHRRLSSNGASGSDRRNARPLIPMTPRIQPPRLKQQLQDVQGIIVRGYAELPAACYVLLGVRDAAATRAWLGRLDVTHGHGRPSGPALNVAFTYHGLQALGLPDQALATFSEEFIEGMTPPHRQRALGDIGASAPERWEWGGPTTAPVDILLMLYAADDRRLAELADAVVAGLAAGGLEAVSRRLNTKVCVDQATGGAREHFGFHDAISQPLIAGLEKTGPDFLTVQTGEIILGYPNEYRKLTERPLVPAERDPARILPEDP